MQRNGIGLNEENTLIEELGGTRKTSACLTRAHTDALKGKESRELLDAMLAVLSTNTVGICGRSQFGGCSPFATFSVDPCCTYILLFVSAISLLRFCLGSSCFPTLKFHNCPRSSSLYYAFTA